MEKLTSGRLINSPKEGEPSKRILGFVIDSDKIPILGLFDEQLEQASAEFLLSRGYMVEKKK